MKGTRISSRYAKSLLIQAIETGIEAKVMNDMQSIISISSDSKEFRAVLNSPLIVSSKKNDMFELIFQDKIESLSFDFLKLLLKNHREQYLKSIAEKYIDLYKTYKSIETVIVTGAYSVESVKDMLVPFITKLFDIKESSSLEIKEKINQDILGGIVLRLKDKQYDASISKQIRELNNVFSTNLFEKTK